jgi:hypothetical protein
MSLSFVGPRALIASLRTMHFLLFALLTLPAAFIVRAMAPASDQGWTYIGGVAMAFAYFAHATWKKREQRLQLEKSLQVRQEGLTYLLTVREQRYGPRRQAVEPQVSVSMGTELLAAGADALGVPHATAVIYGAVVAKDLAKAAFASAKDYLTTPEEQRTLDSWIAKAELETQKLKREIASLATGTLFGTVIIFGLQLALLSMI